MTKLFRPSIFWIPPLGLGTDQYGPPFGEHMCSNWRAVFTHVLTPWPVNVNSHDGSVSTHAFSSLMNSSRADCCQVFQKSTWKLVPPGRPVSDDKKQSSQDLTGKCTITRIRGT